MFSIAQKDSADWHQAKLNFTEKYQGATCYGNVAGCSVSSEDMIGWLVENRSMVRLLLSEYGR